ncbi:DNA ligase D [Sutcliffiella halmapala]|uniref:DNA ligase D n=1 Tax=Sutcliffiella halmapala TaxID=79882 RepID=UPI001B809CCF|nr:DNA ligase D [Sutcliffiella halmapala]
MIKPMLPTLHRDPPIGEEWVYEVKYDGFRCIVLLETQKITLQSRNGNHLNNQFPEIMAYLNTLLNITYIQSLLPLTLDGELAILTSSMKANFSAIQKRGRTKSKSTINTLATTSPATLLIFDILSKNGEKLHSLPFNKRKQQVEQLFTLLDLPLSPRFPSSVPFQYVPFFRDPKDIWTEINKHHGEGMLAKKRNSTYQFGKRTLDWIKIKNFRTATCFITAYQKDNSYFHVGVMDGTSVITIGLFSHGLTSEERQALVTVIKENRYQEDHQYMYVHPGICVDLYFLELSQDQLRQPEFRRFRFDVQVKECSLENLKTSNLNFPTSVPITHPKKPLWEEPLLTKLDYLHYLSEAAPYILPFLEDRLLTVIRFPHGMLGESFYQRNCPDYAPDFVETFDSEGIPYIVCNNLETLLWLGNQLALEFHIPFQKSKASKPSEIVFDLDPPSDKYFSDAVAAALLMKEVFDQLQLYSFVKTSGRKGLQVYIPLPKETYTYEETRKFTEFMAEYLVSKEPHLFTIERLKKNRGTKVYVDFIQHAEGKTIIAPYSLRGHHFPTVATPLFWEEVNPTLRPESFTIFTLLKRLSEKGDPFQHYFKIQAQQPFQQVLDFLKRV